MKLARTLPILLLPLLAGVAQLPGFSQAEGPREWVFPRDHGRHDGFKTEWWYFTGNVDAVDDGKVGVGGATSRPLVTSRPLATRRPFGFELTFFRTSLFPPVAFPSSGPATRAAASTLSAYFAHAHISDLQGGEYLARDLASRGNPKLASAAADRLELRVQNWTAGFEGKDIVLSAEEPGFGIRLRCRPVHGPILEGPGGLSLKGRVAAGAAPNASYYYSFTRLETSGTLRVGATTYPVSGLSWMDHEFASNYLPPELAGWDWFSLHLADGSDLMLYRMRDLKGEASYAFATSVSPTGETTYYEQPKIKVSGSDPWTSPQSKGAYPQRWTVAIEGLGSWDIRTRQRSQEMLTPGTTGINYYEGSIEARGANGGPGVTGYIEMTGYDAPLGGRF
jgi:predicted secreted hydrolase